MEGKIVSASLIPPNIKEIRSLISLLYFFSHFASGVFVFGDGVDKGRATEGGRFLFIESLINVRENDFFRGEKIFETGNCVWKLEKGEQS